MLNFTKEELKLILGDLERDVFSRYYRDGAKELRNKIQYMIEHIERHEKTAAKFEEWQRHLSEKNDE